MRKSAAMMRAAFEERKRLEGLTQVQLADRLGTTQQTLSRWFSGKIPMPNGRVAAMAAQLRLDENELALALVADAHAKEEATMSTEDRLESAERRLNRIEKHLRL